MAATEKPAMSRCNQKRLKMKNDVLKKALHKMVVSSTSLETLNESSLSKLKGGYQGQDFECQSRFKIKCRKFRIEE